MLLIITSWVVVGLLSADESSFYIMLLTLL